MVIYDPNRWVGHIRILGSEKFYTAVFYRIIVYDTARSEHSATRFETLQNYIFVFDKLITQR